MKEKMVINDLFEAAFPSRNIGNSSDNSTGFLPTIFLETMVPGYGPIHKVLLHNFGFDVTVLVTVGVVAWLVVRMFRGVYAILYGLVDNIYISEISVNSTDEIHSQLMAFLATQHKISSSRRLMAETPSKTAWELEDTEAEATLGVDPKGNIRWLNFSNQEAKAELRFTPAIGSHNFWYKGTYFQLKRKEVTVFDDPSSGSGALKDKEVLTLSCFGRSAEPIKQLMQHAKAHYHQGRNVKTVIKRPAPKDMRRYGGRSSWLKVAERPCRPMQTVILDEERKLDLLSDINEYLNPVTARWYANRGIPYRRGYLFYGPPGSGKSSLTFAIAGIFGLDIHVISLLEPTLTEEDLGMLFTTLPARCIVLLEDIDSAGLVRESRDEEKHAAPGTGEQTSNDLNVVNLTKALKKANQISEEEKKKGISLSGLLNIIDGVASHEGRVLVMTTNHPEKLDEALIRPGRVDHQVAFTNATQKQVKELFERMYTSELPKTVTKLVLSPDLPFSHSTANTTFQAFTANALSFKRHNPSILTPPPTPSLNVKGKGGIRVEKDLNSEDLSYLAGEFAEKVPDGLFSPAEIQGFLLRRKTDPRKAVLEVEAWVEGMKKQKRMGTKLVSVQ